MLACPAVLGTSTSVAGGQSGSSVPESDTDGDAGARETVAGALEVLVLVPRVRAGVTAGTLGAGALRN